MEDAVLHLPVQNLPHVFVELDRATMSPGKLINKVAAYDRYRHYTHAPPGRAPYAQPARARPVCRTGSPATRGPEQRGFFHPC
ncbi:replication-relaxation family protein [Streptomyces sp. NPDC058637]|uniref:replication-relaxation family protein n=1 Tax=Streptomyces sp. NPDC058637 TaxID=3346569 RepID=UPI0036546574